MLNTTNARPIATRFGRGGLTLRARGDEYLSLEEIAAKTPSVFAEGKHESRSDKFTFIPTYDLLTGMMKAGLFPVEVRQGGSADAEKRAFTKHMIKFRKAGDLSVELREVGDAVPEIVMVNAHDGTSGYGLMNGWFRKVCSNGLIVSQPGDNVLRVPHRGDIMDKVIEGSYTVLEDSIKQVAAIAEMKETSLSNAEQLAFAAAAAELRFEEGKAPVEPAQINRARRAEDNGSSLWLTMNRAQENLIRGGLFYRGQRELANGQVQVTRNHTRPVNSIDGNVTINRALWRLAAEMEKIKAAA